MNLKYMTDEEFDRSFQISVKKERAAFTVVLNHIVESERRKHYLKLRFSSLHDYLVKYQGYSNGTAQRYIDAAKLMKDFPALPEKLEKGELNLGQVTIVQKAIRQKRKETSVSVSKEAKIELVESLIGKTERESETIVSKALDLQIKELPKVTHQKDESVRFEVTLGKVQWEKLNRLREILSNTIPDGNWEQVLEYVADRMIEQKTKVTEKAKPSEKHLKESTKKTIRNRDQSCQICGTKWHLQTDHIHPQWDNGNHEFKNLQCLCGPHNRQRYKEQAGIRCSN